MDRPLPYLCLYRSDPGHEDPGLLRLLSAQAAYLHFPVATASDEVFLRQLLAAVSGAISSTTDAFLLIELWPANSDVVQNSFKAFCPVNNAPEVAAQLDRGLKELSRSMAGASAESIDTTERHPPGRTALFTVEELKKLGILSIGIEIPRVYWTVDGQYSPLAVRGFRDRLTGVIQRAAQAFIRVQTPLRLEHHLMLGRTTIGKRVAHIDKRLSAIAASFDLLLNVSPVNTEEAWAAFRRKRWEKAPDLHYRLIGVDPDRMKRELYGLRIEAVEDGTFEALFRDKRFELDTQLSLLSERGRPEFLYSALRLYGGVDQTLLAQARSLIAAVDELPERKGEDLSATGFAALAGAEMDRLRPLFQGVEMGLQIRSDVDGVLVSKGQLLIGERLRVDPRRADALIQHEVGTHVLTWCNGRLQPLQLLSVGLSGYDQLQEGLAVLAEFLMNGLGAGRLKLLAGRVVAVHALIQGATFVDCWRLLTKEFGFAERVAFSMTVRVYRGGGFPKDAVYLKGLHFLLRHLHGHPAHLELFMLGKFGPGHIPLLEDLHYRGILHPPVLPGWMTSEARARLLALPAGMPLTDLLHTTH